MQEITSAQNSKIKNIIKLRDASERRDQKLIIIEGYREIIIAMSTGIEINSLFYCPEYAKEKIDDIKTNEIYNVPKIIFDKISLRENPDGYLVLAKPQDNSINKLKLSNNPLLIVLEAVEKPGNLGAVLRTADAAGVDAVLIAEPKTDIYNPNVIRASQGTVFTVPIGVGTQTDVLEFLKINNIKTVATTPEADKLYVEVDYKGPSAIVMGTEATGLTDIMMKEMDEHVRIPMHGKIDSLNVSVSAAIVVYEAVRQRGGING